MWEGGKSWASLLIGLCIMALGAIPLANELGIFSWNIPLFPGFEVAIYVILAIAAFYLAINGFMEILINPGIGYASIGVGILVGVACVLKVLNIFSTILSPFEGVILNVVFFIIGSMLMIGSFMY